MSAPEQIHDTVFVTVGIIVSLVINLILQIFIAIRYVKVIAEEENELEATRKRDSICDTESENTDTTVRPSRSRQSSTTHAPTPKETQSYTTDLNKLELPTNVILPQLQGWQAYVRHVKGSTMLQMEAVLGIITFASNIFFVARIMPIWNQLGCFAFHSAVMVIFELQLLLYTQIQIGHHVKGIIADHHVPWITVSITIVALVLSALSGLFQEGLLGTHGACHFEHNFTVAITICIFHIATDILILYLFDKSDGPEIATLEPKHPLRRIYRATFFVLVAFSLWNVYLAISDLYAPALLLEISYNIHFTFVMLCIAAPGYARAAYSRILASRKKAKGRKPSILQKLRRVSSTTSSTQSVLKSSTMGPAPLKKAELGRFTEVEEEEASIEEVTL